MNEFAWLANKANLPRNNSKTHQSIT